MEKCTNCGRNINDNEKAYVYQGKNVVCGKCYAILIEKSKENPLPGKVISEIWNGFGITFFVLGVFTIAITAYIFLSKNKNLSEDTTTMLGKAIGSFIIGGLICSTVSAIIRAINANTIELRKLREEIKLKK